MDAGGESIRNVFAVNTVLVASDATSQYIHEKFNDTFGSFLRAFPDIRNLQGRFPQDCVQELIGFYFQHPYVILVQI